MPSYKCKFQIVAMWDDENEVRHIRQCRYSMTMMTYPVGLEFFDGMIQGNHRLFVKKVGYNFSSGQFEVLLDYFLCDDAREYDRLFQLWEEADE